MRGQIDFLTAIITALGTVGAAGLMAFAASNSALYEVRQQVSIVEERENNHYEEVKEALDRIEGKLDKLQLSQ